MSFTHARVSVFVVVLCLYLCVAFCANHDTLVSAGPGFRVTPAGVWPEQCIHYVSDRVHIRETSDGVVVEDVSTGEKRELPSCEWNPAMAAEARAKSPLAYDGWLAYTTSKLATGTYTAFLGNFSVPEMPQRDPEVLYIFTGLQNVDWIPIVDPQPPVFDIIQPVLQYPAGSGQGWSVRSWYVTLQSGVVVSDEVPVNVGDSIFGNMTEVSPGRWYVASVRPDGRTTAITVDRQRLNQQPWAYTTVECYGCGSGCDTLPTNSLYFDEMVLTSGSKTTPASWTAHKTPTPVCDTTAHIQSDSKVVYTFQQ